MDEGQKATIFLSTMGPVAYHTLANFLAPSMPAQKNYSTFIWSMDKYQYKTIGYCMVILVLQSFFVNPKNQHQHCAELQRLGKDCNFGQTLEKNLRNRLVRMWSQWLSLSEKTAVWGWGANISEGCWDHSRQSWLPRVGYQEQ